MESSDFSRIASVWVNSLPEDIFSILGEDFISQVYLPQLFSIEGSFGFNDASDGNEMSAFVLFAHSDGLLYKVLVANRFLFIRILFLRVISSPQVLLSILGIAYFILVSRFNPKGAMELCYICVHPKKAGQGLGQALVRESLLYVKDKGLARSVYVKTLSQTPRTIRFYEKCGFHFLYSTAGRVYLYRDIESSASS